MSPINGLPGGALSGDGVGAIASAHGRSLSRAFTRTLRRVSRLVENAPRSRAGTGSALAIGFMIIALLHGAVLGGHGPLVLSSAAKVVGLDATDIVISGQVETRERDVLGVLGLAETRSIVGLDVDTARRELLALPWVEHAAVRKLYPGKLAVELREKTAFAVWQHDESLSVVEQNGALIARFGIADLINNRFSHLPHLVGDGAADHAAQVLPLAARYPQVAFQARAYVRVANRRWDIRFGNGVTVQLPEHGLDKAVARLAQMEREEQILARQISHIDLRNDERIVVRLEPEAADVRAKLVAARAKAMKKAERNL